MTLSEESKTLTQPSVDRIDRNKGYTTDTVVLCCFMANFGRNSNSKEEFMKFLTDLKSNLDCTQWES